LRKIDPVRRFEVERQAALVAVQVLEVGAEARTAETFAGRGRRLDLDDLCAPIRELADGGGASADTGEVEHLEAGKRHGGLVGHRVISSGKRHRSPLMRRESSPTSKNRWGGPRRFRPPRNLTYGATISTRRFRGSRPPGAVAPVVVFAVAGNGQLALGTPSASKARDSVRAPLGEAMVVARRGGTIGIAGNCSCTGAPDL